MTSHAQPSGPAGVPAPLLVGRARERALLRERLAAACAGQGSLVLIGGEAGIGKTALAEALEQAAAGYGALMLAGRCYDLTDTPPYGPWTELLGQVPAVAGLPPPAVLTPGGVVEAVASQAALFAQVRDYLTSLAAQRPLVLLLDDLHWADPASLDLLRFLARGLKTVPLLLLGTYRADELTRRHPLYTLLPLLVREAQAVRLDLHRLDDAAVRALVGARYQLPPVDAARLAAYLQAHAEGNPFYIGEVLRTLDEEGLLQPAATGWLVGDLTHVPVPPLVRQVIDGRLARLGEEVRAAGGGGGDRPGGAAGGVGGRGWRGRGGAAGGGRAGG